MRKVWAALGHQIILCVRFGPLEGPSPSSAEARTPYLGHPRSGEVSKYSSAPRIATLPPTKTMLLWRWMRPSLTQIMVLGYWRSHQVPYWPSTILRNPPRSGGVSKYSPEFKIEIAPTPNKYLETPGGVSHDRGGFLSILKVSSV